MTGGERLKNKVGGLFMLRLILTSVLLLLIAWPATGAEVYSTPGPVQNALNEVFSLAEQTYQLGQHQRHRLDDLGKSFDAALDNLARLSGPEQVDRAKELEAKGIAPKLVVIAADRKARPTIYAELAEKYVFSVDNPMSRAPASPQLRSEHLSEEYRLAWEYFLLRPPALIAAPQYELRAARAISRISNGASLTVLTYSYRITTHRNVVLTRYVSRRQRMLLSTLGQLPGRNALDAIMQCSALSEIQRQKAVIKDTQWDPGNYAYRLLTDQVNYGFGEQWRKVIVEAPAEKLSPEKDRLMQSIKRYWQDRPSSKTNTKE